MKYFNNTHPFLDLFYILCLIEIIFCTDNIYEQISPYVQDSKIVDPYSLYYDRQAKMIKIPGNDKYINADKNEIMITNIKDHQLYCKDSHYEVFARRLINILISKSNFKINDGTAFGHLDLEATAEELEIIKGFGEGKVSIRRIDGIINNVIRPVQISLLDEVLSYSDTLRIYLYENRIIYGTILLSIFIITISLKIKWTRFKVIAVLFDIIFIISYIMTWWELVQENAIKLVAQQKINSLKPSICEKNEIELSVLFLLSQYTGFGKDDCVQYYSAIMSDPALQVTPLHALNHMCSKLFFYPLSVAAENLSMFIETYTNSLSWPVSFFVKGPLFLLMPILIGLLIFLFFGGSMGFRIGPFIHLYLHGKQTPPSSMLLDTNDRQAIEIINPDTSTDNNTISVIKTKKKRSDLKKFTNFEKIEYEDFKKLEEFNDASNEEEIDDTSDEEIDDSSENFLEEKEYEKISRKLKNGINRKNNIKIIEKDILRKKIMKK